MIRSITRPRRGSATTPPASAEPRTFRPLSGAAVPLLAAVLLGLAAGAAAFSTADLQEADPPGLPALPTRAPEQVAPEMVAPSPSPAGPSPDEGGLPWLGDALLVVVLAAALAGLVLLARALLRRRGRRRPGSRTLAALRRAEPPEVEPAPLVAALDAGLVELSDDDRDPRRAVIACWVRLEEAAAAAGVPRFETDTAADLVVRLLRGRGGEAGGRQLVSEPVLASFADVYRVARYATHTVDEQMRTRARTALARLRDELLVQVPQ